MKINPRLELRLRLNLKLLLKQQIELLTLQVQELEKILNEEILLNPLIKGVFKKVPKNFEVREIPSFEVPYEASEIEILERNLRAEFKGKELEIAQELLNFIDEKGFLSKSPEEISYELGIPLETLEKVRKKVIHLEPLGVCSKDIWEFLEIQIEEIYPEESESLKKVLKELKKTRNVNLPRNVKEKLSRLKITPLSSKGLPYKIAKLDAVIEEEDGELVAYLYEDFIDIDINEEYLELYKNSKGKVKSFLKEAFEKYESIRKALEIRKENLRKILNIILQRQEDFLKGKGNLKALTVKEVAEILGVHESTVSRIVNSKYVKTPVGTYPLKFFFVRESVEGVSQDELLNLIREVIENEDKRKPLSDEQIAKILREKGFNIARRTVTKYREILGIPSSRERKKRG
jgi:RNA polymerase sigma-54 factor